MADLIKNSTTDVLPARRLCAGAVAFKCHDPRHVISAPAGGGVAQQTDGLIFGKLVVDAVADFPERCDRAKQPGPVCRRDFCVKLPE